MENDDVVLIDNPCMVSTFGDDFHLRYYAGNGACYNNKMRLCNNEVSTIQWPIIIPYEKFDPYNIKESLRYNIVKNTLS